VIAVLLLGAVAGRLGLRAIERRTIEKVGSLNYERFIQWKDAPIAWPEEALAAAPYPPELTAAARELESQYVAIDREEIKAAVALAGGDSLPPLDVLAKYDALLDAFARIVRRPDYELPAFSRTRVEMDRDDGPLLPSIDYAFLQFLWRMLGARSGALVAEGRIEEALADAETIARGSRIGPYESLIVELAAAAMRSQSVTAWIEAMRACDDPASLRRALAAQNELRGGLPARPAEADALALDSLSTIRELQRRGGEVDPRGLSGRELLEASLRAQSRYLSEVALPWAAGRPERASEIVADIEANEEMLLDAYSSFGFSADLPLREKLLGLAAPEAFTYILATPNEMEAAARINNARARFDLLRVETAGKLFQFERGRAPEGLSELVPDYLPELPIDPWSPDGSPYRRAAEGHYYSLGPDAADDGGKTPFSSRSGTMSGGDVYLPPK
jgi:hypothetical protein